jgi:hypothetical protein
MLEEKKRMKRDGKFEKFLHIFILVWLAFEKFYLEVKLLQNISIPEKIPL